MTADKQRSEIVRYWWEKAEESLRSAVREFEAGSFGFSVNRVYYAAFYAVCAALLERRQTFKKHAGVRAAFHREFIKTGLLDMRWGKLYDQLFEDRQEGDYVTFIEFNREYVEHQIAECTEFLRQIRTMIPSVSKIGD